MEGIRNIWADWPETVTRLAEDSKNIATWMRKLQREDEKKKRSLRRKNNNRRDRTLRQHRGQRRKSDRRGNVVGKCEHDKYDNLVTYREEIYACYFNEGRDLHGTKCGVCSNRFVGDDAEAGGTGKTKTVKATSAAPAFVCVNQGQGCKHVVCNDCFHREGAKKTEGKEEACMFVRWVTMEP